jgi:long-chain acyl-CoA synthetase
MWRILIVTPEDRAVISGPLYHANAMNSALFPFLAAGASVVILRTFDPKQVIATIDRYRCTFMPGVPAMYKLILAQEEELQRHDVSSMTFLTCGSAPVPPSLIERLRRVFAGADVIEGYGLTEGGPTVLHSPRRGFKKLGSAGLPLPGIEVKLVADDGVTEAAVDDVGELWVRGPGNARGYHNLPDVTAARFTLDGWLKTGDLMRKDEDGYYFFVGRADDMINTGGENVYPKEVEVLLLQHPSVEDACVVGVPHAVKGEVPVAFVVPATPGLSEEEVKRFSLERGPAYAHPRRVFFLDTLPLSGTGKVDRAQLEAAARASNDARIGDAVGSG